MDSNELIYKRRFVAFVDILGFADLVEKSKSDRALFENLIKAISIISKQEPFWRDPELDEQMKKALKRDAPEVWEEAYRRHHDVWGMAFSDSLVLSQPDDLEGLFNLLHSLWMLARQSLEIGVLLRGGVSLGPIYHSERTVFGPGLVDAYRLENRVAIYPRIIFSDGVVEAANRTSSLGNSLKNNNFYSKECSLLMRCDFDGLYHLDYLNETGFLLDTITEHQGPRLEQLREVVRHKLEEEICLEPNIRAKWHWTLRYIESKASASETTAA